MKMKGIITTAMALLVSAACSGDAKQESDALTIGEATAGASTHAGKTLVVYYITDLRRHSRQQHFR